MLKKTSITFGKYKGCELEEMLRDRDYCKWLTTQEWFSESYEYLNNRIKNYKPIKYFIRDNYEENNFLENYKFFNLIEEENLEITLSSSDKICYTYYLEQINKIKNKIYNRIENDKENIYDVKAPINYLNEFEVKCGMPRENFKEFLKAYDLVSIPTIIKHVKKEGGIEYKGLDAFNIGKSRSKKQEKWWENLLKKYYNEDIGTQFKYQNCIFDFINIQENTILECKLSLKDLNENQFIKYKLALKKYKIIYLISQDCIIDMDVQIIYTNNMDKYINYFDKILTKNKNFLEELIINFQIIEILDVEKFISKLFFQKNLISAKQLTQSQPSKHTDSQSEF